MANPHVFVLPGFTGSNLDRVASAIVPRLRYWYSPSRIALGVIRYLRLADDGLTPYYQIAGSIGATDLTDGTYGPVLALLREAAYSPIPIAYDWRLNLAVTASRLLPLILSVVGDAPYYIVGYSQGGLLARYLWRAAGLGGSQGQIARIVTVGTPHWGSYEGPRTLGYLGDSYALFSAAALPSSLLNSVATSGLFGLPKSRDLDYALSSWPGLYMSWPNLAQPGGPVDPYRHLVYDFSQYTSFNPSVGALRLADATTATTLLADASTQPPDSQLVCVAGSGLDTAAALVRQGPLNYGSTYGARDGDGVVTHDAAILRTAAVTIYGPHATLIAQSQLLDQLPELLTNGLPSSTTTVTTPGVFVLPGPTGDPGDVTNLKPDVFPPRNTLTTIISPQRGVGTVPEPLPPYCQRGPRGP